MRIVHVPVFSDNYAYLLIDEQRNEAAAVDPAVPDRVIDAAKREGVSITAILTTHHHWDHSDGNEKLLSLLPSAPVYGGDDRIPALTNKVSEGDHFSVGGVNVEVLFTPCHTKGHVLYLAKEGDDKALFTGDTLFIGGCGRFFEGNSSQMLSAFDKIAALPDDTKIFCGHEYTVKNLMFAKTVDPNNEALLKKLEWAKKQREAGQPTIPSTVAEEKTFNPFMRTREPSMAATLGVSGSASDVMAALRQLKDRF